MWLSLFALLLIAAITFFQAVQGLFSAFIMAVLSILSAAVAFGFYETLYDVFLMERMPAYGQAVGLLAIFALSLLAMRMAADTLVRADLTFPIWVNRAGGGGFGFVTAMVMVGTLLIGVDMLPFGRTFLGFSRLDDRGNAQSVMLSPEGFVIGVVGMLSNTTLGWGERPAFADVHPDLLQEIGGSRLVVDDAALTVVPNLDGGTGAGMWLDDEAGAWELESLSVRRGEGDQVTYEPARPDQPGNKWWAVRVAFAGTALDIDGNLRFTPAQVRLLGRKRPGGPTENRYLAGTSDPESPEIHIKLAHSDHVILATGEGGTKVDFVFEVPPEFEPWFIEFKRSARVDLSKVKFGEAGEAPAGSASAGRASGGSRQASGRPAGSARPSGGGVSGAPKPPPPPRVAQGGGRTGGQQAADQNTDWTNKLPVAVDRNELRDQDVKLRGNQISVVDHPTGVAIVSLPDRPPSAAFAITEFWVPPDMRLLQLGQQVTQAGSTAGRALQFASRSVRNFHIIDSTRRPHYPVGEWVIAEVNGRRTIAIQYQPDALVPERAVRERTQPGLRDKDLKETDPWALLFLVPPDTKIVRFTTGRGGQDLNLTAPK